MKLMYCQFCKDIVALTMKKRYCKCRRSAARYEIDGVHAVYAGENAVPIGVGNASMGTALQKRPKQGDGSHFEAWVISEQVPTIRYVESPRKL